MTKDMSEPEIKIPGYRIEQLVGQGGFARVFLALQESLQRTVALKIMTPEMATDQQFCERFLKEGRTVAQLSSHPNIVTIFDIGKQDNFYYMAMEYIGGGTLSQKLKQPDSRLNIDAMILGIANALGCVHRAGFIHRDVKPANILFTEDGIAMLSDFGIAKSLDGNTQLTQVGCSVGTPEYMSPEQVLGKTLDGRSDLYSLGIVIYQVLTGKKLFVGSDGFSTALQHLNEPVPELPRECVRYQGLIDRLLAKKPEDRFQDADQLIHYLRGDEVVERTPTVVVRNRVQPRPSLPGGEVETRRRSGKALIGGGAVVVALIAGVAIFIMMGKPLPLGQSETSEHFSAPIIKPSLVQPEVNPKVARFLEVAKLHEAMGRLTSPPGSNACEAYELVLDAEPGNREAAESLDRLHCLSSR